MSATPLLIASPNHIQMVTVTVALFAMATVYLLALLALVAVIFWSVATVAHRLLLRHSGLRETRTVSVLGARAIAQDRHRRKEADLLTVSPVGLLVLSAVIADRASRGPVRLTATIAGTAEKCCYLAAESDGDMTSMIHTVAMGSVLNRRLAENPDGEITLSSRDALALASIIETAAERESA